MNANQYLHRYGATREMLGLHRPQRPGQRGAEPGGHLPRSDDDGRLPLGPPHHHARSASSTATCPATRRSPSSSRTPRSPATCPSRRSASRPSARRSSSGSRGTRARSPTSPRCSARPAHLWTRTSLRPADVDLALVYDGFTFNAISWLEGLGFCGFGEAQDWLDGGRRIALDGELPVNPHGGQLSEGRTHGFGFIYEAVTQLRHDAGDRQVADAGDRGRDLRRRHPVRGAAPPARRRLTTQWSAGSPNQSANCISERDGS